MDNKIRNIDLFGRIYIFSLFFCANILISPLITTLIPQLWVFLLLTILSILGVCILLKNISTIHLNRTLIYILLCFLIGQFVYGIYCGVIKALTYNAGLLLGIFICIFVSDKYMDIFIRWSTVFIFLLLLGAYIGFIYAFRGGQPVLRFHNPDGRITALYLTTLTNANYGRILRPAGIYDEPGAFSFFICSISLLRAILRKNDFISVLLLFFGIITLGLTHFLVLFCYLLYFIQKHCAKKVFLLFTPLMIILSLILYFSLKEVFDSLLFERINSMDDILNNNRTAQIEIVKGMVDIKTVLWGRIAEHNFNFYNMAFVYGSIESNPLTPLIATGIIASSVYYLFLGIIIIAAFLSKGLFFIYISIFLLFLQRPYFSARSYTVYFVLFFLFSIRSIAVSRSSLYGKRSLV
jgi:hypothetical protein